MSAILEQIKSLNLSGNEVSEVVQSLIEKEQDRSRNDVSQIMSLLLAMLHVARFPDHPLLIAEAEALRDRINRNYEYVQQNTAWKGE